MSVSSQNENSPRELGLALRPLSTGELFHGRYRIVRCIGAGGMGSVYEVVHEATQRRRVLKTMLPSLIGDADLRARFKLEATVTAGIESEHIVEVFDAGFDAEVGMPFLVMEYLRGESLAAALQHRGRFLPADVLTLLHQASLALERTHDAGIVHRDLKPENLFLTHRDDGSPRLKILDFGIAKVVAQSANLSTTRSFGTPLYMAPEQIRGDGDIDGRADLYALGQIAFTLLVGHAYWEAEAESVVGVYPLLLKVAEGTQTSALKRASSYHVSLPPEFEQWFRRATATSAQQRFESATSLVEGLSTALGVPVTTGHDRGTGTLHAKEPAPASAAVGAAHQPPESTHAVLSRTPFPSSGSGPSGVAGANHRRRWAIVGGSALALVVASGVGLVQSRRSSALSHAEPASGVGASTVRAILSGPPATPVLGSASTSSPAIDVRPVGEATVSMDAGAPNPGGWAGLAPSVRKEKRPKPSSAAAQTSPRAPAPVEVGYDPSDVR